MSTLRGSAERTRAIARLRAEEQVPLAELAGQELTLNGVTVRPTEVVLLRWGRTGKAGAYLDVLLCRRRGAWVTSRAALARFERDLADRVRLRAG